MSDSNQLQNPDLLPKPNQNINLRQTVISAIVGLVLIIAVLILASTNDDCNHSQSLDNLYRIVISVAVAAFASIIPGNFEFKYQKAVTATGALGVFALVFLYNPAQLINNPDHCKIPYISGTVYINGKATMGAEVRVLQQITSTNKDGDFIFPLRIDKNIDKYKFRIIYGKLDKKVTVSKDSLEDIEFRFQLDTAMQNHQNANPQEKNAQNRPAIQRHLFTGNLFESTVASYGGGRYCTFSMRYLDIKMKIRFSNDNQDIISSNVTFKAIETANPGCPFQTGAPNTHIYDKGNATISGNNIFISYIADNANNPKCTLTFSGVISGNKITGSLHSERSDMPDPTLVFRITMDVELEKPNINPG